MKLNKLELGLLYLAIANEIDSYTMEMINKDGVLYAQLNILLNRLEKEIKK